MFRPCIDLHEGKVKQIVGGTLESAGQHLRTNFVSERPAAWFAELYRQDALRGGFSPASRASSTGWWVWRVRRSPLKLWKVSLTRPL